jgi:hypothetical protein
LWPIFRERTEVRGVFAQNAIDRGSRKAKAFEMSCRARIRNLGRLYDEAFEGSAAARAFVFLEIGHCLGCGLDVNAFANELAHETPVTDGFARALHVKARVQTIVDETFGLASRDGVANVRVIEAFALEMLPKPRLGATLPR